MPSLLDAMHVPCALHGSRLARALRRGNFSLRAKSFMRARRAHAPRGEHCTGTCIAEASRPSQENAVTTRRLAIMLAPLACLALAEPAFAQNPKTDMQFATTAARGGQAEVALGQMAETKAANADVKAFGQRMVTDHKKAGDELDAAARADGETIPKGLEAEHKATAARFAKLEGAAFDKAYMQQMVEDHQKTIALFEKEAANGKDSHVKQFAQATLPTLREHLKMAQDLESRTGASAQSSK
jgi:putative membrane protein